MELISTNIEGLTLIKPTVFGDIRGHFFETYNKKVSELLRENEEFVQDNQSMSHKNVLRGLHIQLEPHTQGKLVRAITGSVLDVVVDARKNSPSFGNHYTVELNAENNYLLYVPAGCLHGFTTLQDNTIFTYKCTQFYNKASEVTVMWNDPALNIDWQCNEPIVSEKDTIGITFEEYCKTYL